MDTGKIKKEDPDRRFRRVLSASTLSGDKVIDPAGENLGKVSELMIDLHSGRVAYVVLSYGGVLGMGNKLFAVPWRAFRIDEDQKAFVLNINKQRLEQAPGFDKDNWPDMTSNSWASTIYQFYGVQQDWGEREEPRTYRGGGGL